MFNGHEFEQLEHVGYAEFTGVVVVDVVEVTPDVKAVVESGLWLLVDIVEATGIVTVVVAAAVAAVESVLDVAVVVLAEQGMRLYFS